MRKWIEYFERPGPGNTVRTLELLKERAEELDINTAIIATLRGDSALKANKIIGGDIKIIAVTIPPGAFWIVKETLPGPWSDIPELKNQLQEWKDKGLEKVPMDMNYETQEKLEELGIKVVRGTIPFYGIGTAIAGTFKGVTFEQVMTEALRLISGGLIVCVEVAIMAADANAIKSQEEVVVAGGTSMGLDTAVVIKPSTSLRFFDPEEGLEIREIIAIPRVKPKYSPEGICEEYK
jgi:hypothetical protein